MARAATGQVPPDEAEQLVQQHAAAHAAGLGTAAAAAYWVDRTAAATAALQQRAVDLVTGLWGGFTDWYDGTAVMRVASEQVIRTETARQQAAAMHTEYVSQVMAAIREQEKVVIAKIHDQAYRNGANPWLVNARPAEVYRNQFARTGDDELAHRRAVKRAIQIAQTDIMLAARQAEQDAMDEFQVERYRRVIRPELSKTGTCGLCVVASDRVYLVEDLMPLHGGCNCIVMPIDAAGDPGKDINREDLDRIYTAAGSTSAAELKRTRITVDEHGELGPVLLRRGQRFIGPDEVGLRNDMVAAQRKLRDIRQTLGTLERRAAAGEDLEQAIAYSRSRIDQLTRLQAG